MVFFIMVSPVGCYWVLFSRGLDLHIACLDHHASATRSDMKDLWQSHDYSGNFCFPKDGIILWQFREKDEDKKA